MSQLDLGSTIHVLLKELESDPKHQRRAVDALADLGPQAEIAVPALIRLLKQGSIFLRRACVEAIGKIGSGRPGACRALIEALQDADPKVRATAGDSLRRVKPHDTAVIPELLELVVHSDVRVRAQALDTLARIGIASEDEAQRLMLALNDEDPEIRAKALAVWVRSDQVARLAIPFLIKAMSDSDTKVRAVAAESLGVLRVSPEHCVPALAEALEDRTPEVRKLAAISLGSFGTQASSARHALLSLIRNDGSGESLEAADALVKVGVETTDEVQTIIAAFTHADLDSWEKARRIGQLGVKAVPIVCQMLAAGDLGDLSIPQVHSLGRIGPQAYPAVPLLLNLLRDGSTAVREAAAEALGDILIREAILRISQMYGTAILTLISQELISGLLSVAIRADTIPSLIEALKDRDPGVRKHAARAIGNIGPLAGEAGLQLCDLLLDKDMFVKRAALIALGQIGKQPGVLPLIIDAAFRNDRSFQLDAAEVLFKTYADSASAVELLTKVLNDNSSYCYDGNYAAEATGFRRYAAQLLEMIGPKATRAAAALVDALFDSDENLRLSACSALKKIGPSTIPSIIESLSVRSGKGRSLAIDVLSEFGPASGAAVHVLIALLDGDPNDCYVAGAASRALSAIGPAAVPALLGALKSAPPRIHEKAIWLISELADPDTGLQAITEAINDRPLASISGAVTHALANIGQPAVAKLICTLECNDATRRVLGAETLCLLGEEAVDAKKPLARALEDENEEVRANSLLAYAKMAPSQETVHALVRGLRDQSAIVRWSALIGVNEVAQESITETLLSAIIELLRDNDEHFRALAAEALSRFGKSLREEFIRILVPTLQDPCKKVRAHSALAIWRAVADASLTLPVLIDLARDVEFSERGLALKLLGEFGSAASPAVPALTDLIEVFDEQELLTLAEEAFDAFDDREAGTSLLPDKPLSRGQYEYADVVNTLAKIGPSAEAAIPKLRWCLATKDSSGRTGRPTELAVYAAIAMFNTSPETATEVLPTIRAGLSSEDVKVRIGAAKALSLVAGDHRKAAAVLTEIVQDDSESEFWRVDAILALAELRQHARVAVPALHALADRRSYTLRHAARKALRLIAETNESLTRP